MRRFADASGRTWEVVAGRESWGALYAIFIPVEGEGELRQAALKAASYEAALAALDGMDEAELRLLLNGSEPKRLE